MTDIEKAARALARIAHEHNYASGASNRSPDEYAERYWSNYVRQAQAVLTAIGYPIHRAAETLTQEFILDRSLLTAAGLSSLLTVMAISGARTALAHS